MSMHRGLNAVCVENVYPPAPHSCTSGPCSPATPTLPPASPCLTSSRGGSTTSSSSSIIQEDPCGPSTLLRKPVSLEGKPLPPPSVRRSSHLGAVLMSLTLPPASPPAHPAPTMSNLAKGSDHSGSSLEEVRIHFVSGLLVDIKPRELYLLFRPFKGYEGSLIKLTSK